MSTVASKSCRLCSSLLTSMRKSTVVRSPSNEIRSFATMSSGLTFRKRNDQSPLTNRTFTTTSTRSQSTSSTPWFVEEDEEILDDHTSSSSPSNTSTARKIAPPPPPPEHVPSTLHPLHNHLVKSPFLDPHSLAYIDAQAADPGASWTDWIVIASLKQGRERGLRGAIEGVRSYLAANPIVKDLTSNEIDSSASEERPFAPSTPTITGLPTAPSRHAKSRSISKGGSGSTTSTTTADWAMVDAGDLVVHVMTVDAREVWGIEKLWDSVDRENKREAARSQNGRTNQDMIE